MRSRRVAPSGAQVDSFTNPRPLRGPDREHSVAKKPSKAPKERINITYRSAIRPSETIELPFKMLVLADVTGAPDERPFEERPPIRVDKDNFNDVLRETKVRLSVTVKNRLEEGDEAGEFGANLKFESLKDFTPGGVAQQVPELAKLLELREALSALIQRESAQRLARLGGSEPQLNNPPRRQSEPA